MTPLPPPNDFLQGSAKIITPFMPFRFSAQTPIFSVSPSNFSLSPMFYLMNSIIINQSNVSLNSKSEGCLLLQTNGCQAHCLRHCSHAVDMDSSAGKWMSTLRCPPGVGVSFSGACGHTLIKPMVWHARMPLPCTLRSSATFNGV